MIAVSVEEAQARLAELIDSLQPGDELTITRNDQTVARLVSPTVDETTGDAKRPARPRFRSARGKLTMSDDFEAPLDDFQDDMP